MSTLENHHATARSSSACASSSARKETTNKRVFDRKLIQGFPNFTDWEIAQLVHVLICPAWFATQDHKIPNTAHSHSMFC